MRSILAITVSVFALTGCVTENSYEGSDRPVVEKQVNNTGAARTRIALALQYLKTGNNSQAKYNLERAADFAPDLPEVHYSLAYYYQQVDEPELADKAYQRALKIAPNDPNTLNNYGVFLCGIGEYDRAAEELLKAISIPSYIRVAESYENLALCAIEFDDFENAEKYLKSALNHSSQRPSSMISLAGLYYAKSDLHKAEDIIEKYESTGRVTPRALMLSYLIQQRMGHIEKAEATAGIILQTYPGSNEAKAITSGQVKRSEFEILREKYRQAQLEELQISSDNSSVSKDQPKIRIVKRKAPTKANETVIVDKTDVQTSNAKEVYATNQQKSEVPAINEQETVESTQSVANMPAQVVEQAKTQPEASGFKTEVASTATEPVDTEAVVNALAIKTPEQKKSISTPKAANDEVTIVSFGAPTSPEIKQQTSTSAKAVSKNESTVIFYQPEKDENVFGEESNYAGQTSQTSYSVTSEQIQLPMLNPRVPALNIPYHIIENGENLFSISVRYNVKLQKILLWNGLKESDRVQNGTRIYLNDPNIYHDINAGDTLYDIATQHSVLIDQLMRWNKLSPDVALKPGHRLLLVDPDSYAL
ncbi:MULTISPECIES: type IV pilus biogenesis/stability protein PilW [unclassified Pseudoalteromonas]|uniref:type IV pilus biogenesis/stability protein PilW n=1 Tax=unclassified Pseudoalteromonas TaxID=194690 RepID=UPI00110A4F99|nr:MULTISPECIES: type IV pilus biogenesis/stability protein PilW [unclassified Pseudoalteromonas]TMP44419.1 type IV pilus biogenesis/stability protein PilW [Pseudoalteromonas sp. S1650]TMP65041.1 type IV pilus biogenesis/stability protein PilW [Pseudoalteromonas sp. S1649]